MIQLHIYGILAVLEVLLVVSGLAVYLYVRNRRHNRTIARLNASLRARPEPEASTPSARPAPAAEQEADTRNFSDFLREELDTSSRMLGSAGADGDSEDEAAAEATPEQDQVRQMLAARHQFLQLELDAQAMDRDPEAQRQHLVEQMQNLLATFTPEAAETAEIEEAEADTEDTATVAREQQLETQLEHLRGVVSNQQDVMRELRELLEKEMGESEEMRDVIAKLQDAEASSLDLERSLEAMGKSHAMETAGSGSGMAEGGSKPSPDSDMLRDLVGSQQQTISNLQSMLKQSVGEKEASVELRDAMEKIQRSNQELGTCVMVLEDENSLLRDQIQSLQSQLDEFMGGEETRDEAERMPDASADLAETEPEPGVDTDQTAPEPEVADAGLEPETDLAEALLTGDDEEPRGEAAEEAGVEAEAEAAPEPEPTTDATATETEIVGADADAVVEDIDALLEAAGGEPAQAAPAEPEPEETTTDVSAEAESADDGINTLKDVGLDSDDDNDDLSDDDINALLSGEKKN